MRNIICGHFQNLSFSLLDRDDCNKLTAIAVCCIGRHCIGAGNAFRLVIHRIDWDGVFYYVSNYCTKTRIRQNSIFATVQAMPNAFCCDLNWPPCIAIAHKHLPVLHRSNAAGIFSAHFDHNPGFYAVITIANVTYRRQHRHRHIGKRSKKVVGVYAAVPGQVHSPVSADCKAALCALRRTALPIVPLLGVLCGGVHGGIELLPQGLLLHSSTGYDRQHTRECVENLAARQMVQAIDTGDCPSRHTYFEPRLQVRASTAPPKNTK